MLAPWRDNLVGFQNECLWSEMRTGKKAGRPCEWPDSVPLLFHRRIRTVWIPLTGTHSDFFVLALSIFEGFDASSEWQHCVLVNTFGPTGNGNHSLILENRFETSQNQSFLWCTSERDLQPKKQGFFFTKEKKVVIRNWSLLHLAHSRWFAPRTCDPLVSRTKPTAQKPHPTRRYHIRPRQEVISGRLARVVWYPSYTQVPHSPPSRDY